MVAGANTSPQLKAASRNGLHFMLNIVLRPDFPLLCCTLLFPNTKRSFDDTTT